MLPINPSGRAGAGGDAQSSSWEPLRSAWRAAPMLGVITAGLRKLHAACVWNVSVHHRERMVEPAQGWTKRSLASALGQGHLLPGQRRGSPPARAGKSPTLPGAARVGPDLELGESCRIRGNLL